MTSDQRQDLTIRLEALLGEYVAASQRTEAVGKLGELLANVQIVDAPAAAELVAAEAEPVAEPVIEHAAEPAAVAEPTVEPASTEQPTT